MGKRLVFHALIALAVPMALGCAGILAYGWWLERPFLSYENLPFPAHLKEVHPGDVIPLTVRRCNSDDVTRFYDITHSLRSLDRPNDPPLILPSERVSLEPGCTEGTSRINRIPAGTPPGRYIASGLGIVEGTLRTFAVPWHSEPFLVSEP